MTREEIEVFYQERIGTDPTTSPYFKHYGIRALGAEIAYKIDLAKDILTTQFAELINPESEIVLLSKLMYQDGYIRFQKPFSVSCKITPTKDVVFDKNQEYTDGSNIYICREKTYLRANQESEVRLELGQAERITSRINRYDKFFKVPTEYTYRDIYDIEVYKGTDKLNFSQNFANEEGDYSLEILNDGTIQLVFKTTKRLKVNDTLKIYIYTTRENDETPFKLTPIQDENIDFSVSNIVKISNYEKYMSREEMQDLLKYSRDAGHTLIHNENYHNYLINNVNGIEILKVWQEYDELRENPNTNTTNKIYLSYISTNNVNLDTEIVEAINRAVYGKPVIIRPPKIIEVGIYVTVESRNIIPTTVIGTIKESLAGYYDDNIKKFNKDYIYRKIKDALFDTRDLSVNIQISDKGSFKNNAFYLLNIENISINIKRV